MTLFKKDFAKVFSDILKESGVTSYQIHKYTYLDQAYISRLKTGKKGNPSPEAVVKICLALAHFSNKIAMHDLEALFNATGHTLSTK